MLSISLKNLHKYYLDSCLLHGKSPLPIHENCNDVNPEVIVTGGIYAINIGAGWCVVGGLCTGLVGDSDEISFGLDEVI